MQELNPDRLAQGQSLHHIELTFVFRTGEVTGSNIRPEVSYPDWSFRDFSESLQVNTQTATYSRPRQIYSNPSLSHYS
jgi:hypothetical protein